MPTEIEEKEDEVVEEKDEESEEDEKDDKGEKDKKSDSDDEDTILARKLYKTLNEGGESAQAVVLQLAKQLGLNISELKKQNKNERSDEIKSAIEEELGEEYAFLAKKIERGLTRWFEENVNPKITSLTSQNLQTRLDHAIESVLDDNGIEDDDDREKMITKMNRAAKNFVYAKGGDIDEYVDGLFTLASNSGKKNRKKIRQIQQNLEDGDIPSYDVPSFQIRKGPEKPTLEQAVADAARGIKYKD